MLNTTHMLYSRRKSASSGHTNNPDENDLIECLLLILTKLNTHIVQKLLKIAVEKYFLEVSPSSAFFLAKKKKESIIPFKVLIEIHSEFHYHNYTHAFGKTFRFN